MSRQLIRKGLLYCASIVIFWNMLVAIRAYKFSHFKTITASSNVKTADMFQYALNRFSGPDYYKIPTQTKPTVPFTTIQLVTSNDLKLEGWLLETAESKGTVILFHGLNGNKERMLPEAYSFQKMGYTTMLIDFRAHGNSEGSACTLGLEEAEDVKLAYNYIRNKGEKNITLFGASMGAATISYAIKKYSLTPEKVILEMPFASYSQLIEKFFKNSKYPTEPTSTLFTFWSSVFNREWFFNMKPSNYVKAIHCPVLVQWGQHDDLVPEDATNKIYTNITAPKQLKVYEKSGHESFCVKEPEVWKATVESFLQN
jgi:uncharacterized protein